jgi:hypothetical protein
LGKGCYSLPYIDYCGCSTRLLTLLNTDLSYGGCYSYVDTSIDTAITIPQSVHTQKVVTNTLVYLVYSYYNLSTMKERDQAFLVILVFCCFLVVW